MRKTFLTIFLFAIVDLFNCTAVYRYDEADKKQLIEADLEQGNTARQQNTAFQTSFLTKRFRKRNNRQQRIPNFRIKMNSKSIQRYQKVLAAFHKRLDRRRRVAHKRRSTEPKN